MQVSSDFCVGTSLIGSSVAPTSAPLVQQEQILVKCPSNVDVSEVHLFHGHKHLALLAISRLTTHVDHRPVK